MLRNSQAVASPSHCCVVNKTRMYHASQSTTNPGDSESNSFPCNSQDCDRVLKSPAGLKHHWRSCCHNPDRDPVKRRYAPRKRRKEPGPDKTDLFLANALGMTYEQFLESRSCPLMTTPVKRRMLPDFFSHRDPSNIGQRREDMLEYVKQSSVTAEVPIHEQDKKIIIDTVEHTKCQRMPINGGGLKKTDDIIASVQHELSQKLNMIPWLVICDEVIHNHVYDTMNKFGISMVDIEESSPSIIRSVQTGLYGHVRNRQNLIFNSKKSNFVWKLISKSEFHEVVTTTDPSAVFYDEKISRVMDHLLATFPERNGNGHGWYVACLTWMKFAAAQARPGSPSDGGEAFSDTQMGAALSWPDFDFDWAEQLYAQASDAPTLPPTPVFNNRTLVKHKPQDTFKRWGATN